MFKGILFDLDGTLLDIDLESFLAEYFTALGPVLAHYEGSTLTAEAALEAVMTATRAMSGPHPGRTNREVFNEVFSVHTGLDLDSEPVAARIEAFYAEQFPKLQHTHGPRSGAREAYEAAKRRGLTPVLATNPIFPREAIVERLRWAGFSPEEFAGVTSYENMQGAKPLPAYFRQACALADLSPSECLMVGDDRVLDAAAADIGMSVFYVGPEPAPAVDWAGSFEDLIDLIERLAPA